MKRISSHIQTIAVCLTAFVATFCLGQNRFVQVPHYSAGGNLPTLLVQDDVNGDGKLDLIVLNVNTAAKTETVSLLLGTGTGGYEAPKTMATYPSSYGVPVVGDVNRDGHLDLIFSVSGSSPQTRVYLGSGETFETTAIVSTGVNCASFPPIGCEMQLADLNKDGNPDLVEYGQNGVAAMLGDGNGSFKAPVYAPDSRGPFAIGDFNNDGIPDIADTGHNGSAYGLQIQPGNGDGTFRSSNSLVYTYFNGRGGSFGVPVTADLRGNGDTDVIIPLGDNSTCGSGGFVVLLGNGNGTFASNPMSYASGGYTYGITVIDMNGDEKPDLVVANQEGTSYSVFLNQGSGKFGTAMNYMVPQGYARGFIAGDLAGNGRPDLTVSSYGGVYVFVNAGGGQLRAPQALELDAFPNQAFWAVDVNRDGIPDLEVSVVPPGGCNDPQGSHGEVLESRNGVPFANAVPVGGLDYIAGGGDFNGDGWPDLLTGGYEDVQVLFNNTKGAFQTLIPVVDIANEYQIAVEDFNRDGYADIAAVLYGGGLQILIGEGYAGFREGMNYSTAPTPTDVFARDVNGDGKIDLIILFEFDNALQVRLGNSDGTFQAAQTYNLSGSPQSLTFADFNNDGKLDIAVGDLGGQVQVLLNNGNGTFKSPVNYAGGGVNVTAVAAIDLTGNGIADLLVADGHDNKIFLLTGNGTGTLSAPKEYYAGGSEPTGLAVADYNLDGAPDVVVSDTPTQGFMVLYNTGGTRVTLTSLNKTPTAGQTVTFTATIAASVPGSGTPTGTVTFKNGSATLGTTTLGGGKATFHTASLSKGTHSITARYNGSTNFNPHASAAVTETVR